MTDFYCECGNPATELSTSGRGNIMVACREHRLHEWGEVREWGNYDHDE